ncbi:MAG TPA: glycoside hydrolase family 30 protein [Chryseosolibacter sp.]|nr:glycoside hydrolase family 30 protein [Chryseosolibacter sp.]
MKHLATSVLFIVCVTTYGQAPLKRSVTVYTTAAKSDLRLTKTATSTLEPFRQPFETEVCVFVDPRRKFQTFLGIGAAMTDASAETFAKLDKKNQDELLTAYFDKDRGIGYSIARTHINSCDFSSGTYTYVKENDAELATFDVSHDEKYRIPFIKAAIAKAGGTSPLYVSPWSPPAWMKDNNNMLQGGKLLPGYHASWANYYIKFIQAYETRGIPVWGLTVQNEPMAKQRWESCIYTAEEERDFVKNHLGPTLHGAGMGDKKLIAWDHNRDLIYQRASTLFNDPDAAKYIWGIGFHWYETWTGSAMQFDNLKRVQEAFPDKKLIFTEGCVERFDLNRVDDWSLGERYGRSLINDFNSGTVAWTDWNILLDETGGPNHVGNFCFAPVHADTRTGKLIFTNAYYYLGHFSRFIKPGWTRVVSSSNRDKLLTTAFASTDGKLSVVVMNLSDDPIDYRLWIEGTAAELKSMPHSIATLVVE